MQELMMLKLDMTKLKTYLAIEQDLATSQAN